MTADNFSEAARAEAVRPGRKQADPVTEQQIDQRERELDYWMARAYEAEGKLWKAEARIRHLEATAQVLAKEVLDAENARDESRRGKVEAEARIRAVKDVLAHHPYGGPEQEDAIRQALDGDA